MYWSSWLPTGTLGSSRMRSVDIDSKSTSDPTTRKMLKCIQNGDKYVFQTSKSRFNKEKTRSKESRGTWDHFVKVSELEIDVLGFIQSLPPLPAPPPMRRPSPYLAPPTSCLTLTCQALNQVLSRCCCWIINMEAHHQPDNQLLGLYLRECCIMYALSAPESGVDALVLGVDTHFVSTAEKREVLTRVNSWKKRCWHKCVNSVSTLKLRRCTYH